VILAPGIDAWLEHRLLQLPDDFTRLDAHGQLKHRLIVERINRIAEDTPGNLLEQIVPVKQKELLSYLHHTVFKVALIKLDQSLIQT